MFSLGCTVKDKEMLTRRRSSKPRFLTYFWLTRAIACIGKISSSGKILSAATTN